MKTAAKCLLPPLVAAGIMMGSMGIGHAAALPTGGAIVNGNGTITVNGSTMTINQYTARMIANWESFSIGSDGTVNFVQPDSRSVALNRVIGNDVSSIYGNLNANGQVFLVNENGTLFSPTSQVNVGSLVTSSLNISDSDFLAGNYKFSGSDNSGAVVNQGTITAKNGGYVALMGPQVKNEGVIVARQGTVALGAGKAVTMDMNGDGLLNLAVNQAAVNASVANRHLIQADGGRVIMTGRAAKDLVGTVVNNSGIIQARSINNVNGVIRLDGGTSGTVSNSGTLDASGRGAGETGGTVKVLGENVQLATGTNIDVSGAQGGGTALIGGNYQGKGPEQNATTAYVDKDAKITADAITSGNGGKVVVWADDKTVFNGTISAKGGANGGDGGEVETSGHNTLKVGAGARVTTLAPKGKTGNWLLDPANFTIAPSGGDITGEDLASNLKGNNITINSNQGKVNTNGNGSIFVNDAVNWTSPNTLTLRTSVANSTININAPITATNGGLRVWGSSSTTINSPAAIDVGTFTLSAGKWRQVASEMGEILPFFSAKNFSVAANSSFVRVKDGDGSSANPYQLTDAYMLQAIGLCNSLLNQNFSLANDIDLSMTKTWNNGQGFTPIGKGYIGDGITTVFTGSLDGKGHTIDNLYINYSRNTGDDAKAVGLFGMIGESGLVRNLSLTNVDITGSNLFESSAPRSQASRGRKMDSFNVGGLVGLAESATIDNVYVTGKVTGINANAVGGLAGMVYEGRRGSQDSVLNSGSEVAVTARGFNDGGSPGGGQFEEVEILPGNSPDGVAAGGLIGQLVYNSELNTVDKPGGYKGGVVTSTDTNFVKNSYSSGSVTVINTGAEGVQHSTIYAGGLVGLNQGGSIDQAYSTGAVTVNSTDPKSTVHAGGLVGASNDSLNTWDMGAYWAPLVTAIYNGETISNSYSTGKVSYGGDQTHVGGLAGSNSGTVSQSFWDTDRSGQSKGIGADSGSNTSLTGLTTAQMVAHKSNFAGWDFDNTWYMIEGYTTPFLRSEYSTNIRNAHQLQLMAMDPTAHYTLAADLDLRGYHMAPTVGFVPINNFSGSFNGQGHTVSYLNIHDYATGTLGLFGTTLSNAKIHDVALANASITGGAGNTAVSILVGDNAGSIYNVFTGGTVSGSGKVGGIAGKNSGSLAASFSGAKVTGPTGAAGGLVGDNSGTIRESYLDDSGRVNGSSAGGLIAGSNSGTVIAPTYSGADWVSQGGNHYLSWTVAPDGTIGLYTPSQLQAIENFLSGKYRLGGDLDLSGLAWNPIGTAAGAFTGALNGNHYTINNLTIANSGAGAIGLFGYTQGAALSNLTLTNVNIAGGAASQYVGGLVGSSTGGSIVNAMVSGMVKATGDSSYVGGIAGYTSGSIAGSGSAATVDAAGANSYAGGLAGSNAAGGSIAQSYNTGAVTAAGTGSYAGGLAGQNAGTIALAYNTGAVTTDGYGSSAGGVAGSNAGTIGSNAGLVYNSGAVTTKGADSSAGGVAGKNTGIVGVKTGASNTGTVYNTGAVTAEGAGSKVGGVAGDNAGTITQAYAAAVVAAKGVSSYAGGVAGYNSGSILSAFFGPADSGLVAKVLSDGANSSVGGIAGYNSGTIADTISLAVVSSSGAGSKVGGLIGDNAGGSLDTSYTLGAVIGTADSSVGGLIGSNSGTVANAIWNKASSGRQNGVGTGTDAGTALTYTQMLQGNADYWPGWSAFTNWNTYSSGVFPGFSWSPTYMLYGRVMDGGPGVTVTKYDYDWVSRNILPYTTETIGADGLFLMTAGGTQYNSTGGNPHTVLFTVADQPYKANSIYAVGAAGSTVFYDMKKDTLLFSVPDGQNKRFNFKNVFDSPIVSGAVALALADNYSDLLFTMAPVYLVPGDAHDPGGVHDTIYLSSLDVAGNFEAKNFDWYTLAGEDKTYVSAGSVTTHQTAYANGDITIDNSQKPVSVYSYAGNRVVNGYKQLTSAGGKEAKFVADGDITLTENENIAIGSGSGPRIIAGGDVTITTGGMFINWAGPDAIQAGGRYLVYASDMLLTSWVSPESPSSEKDYRDVSNVLKDLFFGTRYNDYTYKTAMQLMYPNDHLVVDTRGGLPGFVQWGYQGGDVPAGSGFVYTAGDPGTVGRLWMTPGYFGEQDRRQWAADTAQADNAGRPGLAADSATPDVRDGILQATIVDGGVALPDDENGEE
jgi:filamentous hemagglutinin family protein